MLHYLKTNPKKYSEELSKSFYYSNGSCYYLPPVQSKKTWLDSKNHCELIGSNDNSGLYSFENNSLEYDFVIDILEKYFIKSNAKELSFYISLSLSNQSKNLFKKNDF